MDELFIHDPPHYNLNFLIITVFKTKNLIECKKGRTKLEAKGWRNVSK